jgi:hypothetical protein
VTMRARPIALLFLVCALVAISCQPGSGRDLAGKYTAVDPRSDKKTLSLELKSDGKGSWKIEREEIPFTWEDRVDVIWLHAKSGGVLRGDIGKDRSISISLPDVGSFRFERTDS